MKKLLCFCLFVLFFNTQQSSAQDVIAVTKPNGQTAVFNLLDDAVNNAGNGDYIYLPGGVFTLSVNISKGIKLIGTGHYPDSTVYTDRTIIQGNLSIAAGAHQLLVEGIYLTGNISFVANNRSDNVVIRRCNIGSIAVGTSWNRNDTAKCYNPQFVHNVIRGNINLSEAYSFLITGNIISGQIQVCIYHGGMIENNVFLSKGINATLSDLRFVNFKNNIFLNDTTLAYSGYACYGYDGSCGTWGSTFINNLFVGKATATGLGSLASVSTNNIFQIAASTIFLNHTGSSFDYMYNYHLQSTCAGVNAGNDGRDVGIYGTSNPYKAGAVPINPHISYKNVPASTLPNGTIQVNFKVGAQDR